jgi:hypothetical protein
MRADSVSTVSPSSTGTAACVTNRAGIQIFVHEVYGTARHLDAMLQRLVLRRRGRERGQQRRVDVQHAAGKFADESGAEQAHVSGQADQVDLVLFQLFATRLPYRR